MKASQLIDILTGYEDFDIVINIKEEIPENERNSTYPYPYNHYKATMEFADIGYSDKEILFSVIKDK